ncbi:MAG TPA: hypothetical protein DCX07_09120 [Phycisphaerales bacterium]|nr:hypothetical protein [Phycisphaerales bacterium]
MNDAATGKPRFFPNPSCAHLVAYAAVALACTAVSLLCAAWGSIRSSATIILFVPLLWGFMIFRPAGMIVCGLLVGAMRVSVEAIHRYVGTGQISVGQAAAEVAFVLALYLALGLAFYLYRHRQALLTERLLRIQAKELAADLSQRLAHDLNNVFTVASGTVEMLPPEQPGNPQYAMDVETIRNACRHGIDLVRQFRNSYSLGGGQRAETDLSKTVDQQLQVIRGALAGEIEVQCRYCPVPLPVHLDVAQFRRVLMNLCVNARDAMPEGGTLTLATERQTVGAKEFALLSVSDTGKGIDPKHLPRIFEPFFTTREDRGGTGLGLSICRAIIEECDGHIDITSRFGLGTTVVVLVPLSVPADDAPVSPASTPA